MNCANHPDRERISFCQNCGKPLCAECLRSVGSATFCEPCLAARLAAADAVSGQSAVPGFPAAAAGASSALGTTNPLLAGALGFIPGVGAMYNGQYAKGVVHLIIFVVLVSLANQFDAFGFLVAGWEFYQAFEAYHTARARRDGTPLPNPFGLNDVGERFGFGKAWPSAATTPVGAPMAASAAAYPPASGPPFVQAADGGQTFAGGDSGQSFRAADGTTFRQETSTTQVPFTNTGWGVPGGTYAVPPFADPHAPPYLDPQLGRNRFPAGAIWLIALGLLFFLGSTGFLRHFPIHRVIPFLLIGLGIWLFVRRLTASGPLADDGSPAYRLRLFHAARGSVWVILVGVLFLLDTFNILSWGHSWPLFIILAGLMTLFQRAAYTAVPITPYGYPNPVPPSSPAPTPSSVTSAVPGTTRDQKGS